MQAWGVSIYEVNKILEDTKILNGKILLRTTTLHTNSLKIPFQQHHDAKKENLWPATGQSQQYSGILVISI